MKFIAFLFFSFLALSPVLAQEGEVEYAKVSDGTRILESGPLQIKMLVEASNFGTDDLEVGEITFPVTGEPGGEHVHQSNELFYVLEGTMGHTVNGEDYTLTPGMIAIVRIGDRVRHTVLSEEPVKALVIWLPGGEADRLVGYGFEERPVEQE